MAIKAKDLIPTDARAAFRELAAEIGADSYVSAGLNIAHNAYRKVDEPPLYCTVYPHGITKSGSFSVTADDWCGLVAIAKAKWAEHSDEYDRQTIRSMALEIIRLTAELGECTDAALRTKFSFGLVQKYSERACADANTMASNGPFTVVTMSGANSEGLAA